MCSLCDAARRCRELEASQEISRILPLRDRKFCSEVMRAKAILGLQVGVNEVSLVHQAFRSLMRKLHPDRIGNCPKAAQAIDLLQEAKQLCEKAFSQLQPPNPPQGLSSTVLCAAPGRRRIRLDWTPDMNSLAAPVRRYLVAALDPAYGQALTITVLEPEYNETLKRFTTIEELTTYDLAEEELSKLPSFFQQAHGIIRVAAENEVGQSSWSSIQLTFSRMVVSSVCKLSRKEEKPKRLAPSGPAVSSRERRDFEATAHSLRDQGGELCAWLRKQSKALLSGWLKSQGWPTTGSKDELVDRVAFAVGAVSKVK
ncbi:Uncharacterized protein SCF082_LOCUS10648 [Durusdinium trenchii]|uniref:J domain-containing protein n=1 Tax=Durusdinium trenchii TaxID=1381693 RepID=A0ABP0J7T7_9DINO